MNNRNPSVFALEARLSADFETGVLTWKSGTYIGKTAGKLDHKGYLLVTFNGVRLRVHRVIYAMHKGEWPDGQIDHINGEKLDNRIANLRVVNNSLNQQNKIAPNGKTRTGARGVTFTPLSKVNPYRVEITVGGARRYMGSFPTVEAASAVYMEAKRAFQTEAVKGRFMPEAI